MTEMATTTKTKLLTPIAVIVGGFAMLVVAAGLLLIRTPAEPTLNDLTKQTITAADQYRAAPSKSKSIKRADFIKVADKRIKKLRALIITNPEQVLAAAIPQATIANIPPELQPYTEQYVTGIKGSYGIITSDDFEKQTSKDWQVFNSEDGKNTYNLYPTGKLDLPPIGINKVTGTVSGVSIDSNLALTPQSAAVDTPTQTEATTAVTGPQNTLVVKVNFSDYSATTPTTATLQDLFFNRTGTTRTTGSINSYYQEVSYNKISVTGTVIGPYAINIPRSLGCGYEAVWNATIAAVDSVVNFTQYQHLVVVAPFSNCSFSGIATLGKPSIVTLDGPVNISESYITGNNFQTATHEFGHQLGNHHARFLFCGYTSFGSDGWSTGCSLSEYGDGADVLGSSEFMGQFNVGHKNSLGWLSPTNILTPTPTSDLGPSCVQNSLVNSVRTVTCTIEPIETCLPGIACRPGDPVPTGLKAIRLNRAENSDHFLSIEYRQPLGFDAIFVGGLMPTNDFTAGALVHVNYSEGWYTDFIDTTTSATDPGSFVTPALLPGLMITDPLTNATITTLSATPSALTVRITTGKHDFTPPTISSDSVPSGLSYVDNSIDVIAQVTDPSGISKVEFYVNSSTTPFTTVTSAPYTAHIDTSSYAEGSLSITAKAYDSAGDLWGLPNNVNSITTNYTVDHPPYSYSTVTVRKGTMLVKDAVVEAYNNASPPGQVGPSAVTNVDGQAWAVATSGTNVKFVMRYGYPPGGNLCRSNETGYAIAPHNETLQLPMTSSFSIFDSSGNLVSPQTIEVTDMNDWGVCSGIVKTGDPLYIQPGLSVKFRFMSGNHGATQISPYYIAPVQAKFCVDATGTKIACPSLSIIPDFTHVYTKDGYGCDDYGEIFSIPFKIQNGSTAVTAKPRGTVERCDRDRATDPWKCSVPVSATVTPLSTDLVPNQEASFTLTTPPGSIRGGDYYRYSLSEDWGSTVVSEVTQSACQF